MTQYLLSPSGSDFADGSVDRPWKTFGHALPRLRAGDHLGVTGGVYRERISAACSPGTPNAPVIVEALFGHSPLIEGLLWLRSPTHWHLSGLKVTWDPATGSAHEHMVKLIDGTDWRLSDSELWGARSFAALLVAGAPARWRVDHCYIHDTLKSNGTNQDHLVYANCGTGGGVIDHCVLAHSANGRAVKLGPASSDGPAVANVTIDRCTMYDNRGPSNVQLAWRTTGCEISNCLMVAPAAGRSCVTAYELAPDALNIVLACQGWQAPRVLDHVTGLIDGGHNVLRDPHFADVATGDFHPLDAASQAFGAYST